jgi:uncharacterized membrane protein
MMGMMRIEQQTQIIHSPFPPPEVLAAYENVVRGSADRLISMAEKEQTFQHNRTKEAQLLQRLGLIFGFVLALVVMAGGVWVILAGQSWKGLCLVMSGGGSLIGIAIWGTARNKVSHPPGDAPHPQSAQATPPRQ